MSQNEVALLEAITLWRNKAYAAGEESLKLAQENDELRAVLRAVRMDAVGVGAGENVISDATRSMVDDIIEKVGADATAK